MKKLLSLLVLLLVVAFSITACKSFAKDTSVQNSEESVTTTDISMMV